MSLDVLSARKCLFYQSLHTLLDLRANATSIKIYSIDLSTTQLGQQFVLEHGADFIIGHMERIEPHSVDLYLRSIATRLEAYPISLCTTTISYQNRHEMSIFSRFCCKSNKKTAKIQKL